MEEGETMTDTGENFEAWAIVELMGHRRIGGLARSPGGPGGLARTMRVDIHEEVDGKDCVTTQFYGPSSIYCVTPTTEETARRVARGFHRPLGEYRPSVGYLHDGGGPGVDEDVAELEEGQFEEDGWPVGTIG